jgi:hypothetical protein
VENRKIRVVSHPILGTQIDLPRSIRSLQMVRVHQHLIRVAFLIAAWCSLSTAIGAETNHNFSRWEGEIAAYEAADRTNPPPRGGVLFIGSSTIRLWKTLARDFPGQPVINRGVGGCQIVDCTYFADRIVFPYQPRQIVFRCGGNDLWDGKSPETVFTDFKDFVTTVHARLPDTEIVFVSLSPTVARLKGAAKEKSFNTLVQEYVRNQPRLKYVETYDMVLDTDGQPRSDLLVEDRLHFNSRGYELLAERVRPFVLKPVLTH